MTLPRGIRNNNPGNIERRSDRWLGMSADQSGDSRFVVFDTPAHGIRAIMRILINYQERHGLHTVRAIIHRWAPPVDSVKGRQPTDAYVDHVCARLDVAPNQPIDLLDRATNLAFTKAIVMHENGIPGNYGREAWYSDAVYAKAAALAGFEPPEHEKPKAKKSATVAGGAAAGVATIAGAVTESIPQAADLAQQAGIVWPEVAKWVFIGVVLAGVVVVIADRFNDDRKRVT